MQTAIVGRVDEVARLRDLVRQVVAGHGAAVLVEGEPGVGKSVLLDVVEAESRARGACVLRGGGGQVERPVPFATLASWLRTADQGPEYAPFDGSGSARLTPRRDPEPSQTQDVGILTTSAMLKTTAPERGPHTLRATPRADAPGREVGNHAHDVTEAGHRPDRAGRASSQPAARQGHPRCRRETRQGDTDG
jgi:hypothetical protein